MKAAGILFTDGKSILLLKGEDWELPGGKAKIGENSKQNAQRESREECGKVTGEEIDKFVFKDFTIFVYKVNKPFTCRLSKEHKDWKWVKISNIKQYKLREELNRQLPGILKTMHELNFKEWLEIQNEIFESEESKLLKRTMSSLERNGLHATASNLLATLREIGASPEQITAVSKLLVQKGYNYGDLNKADVTPDPGTYGSGPGYRERGSLETPLDRPEELERGSTAGTMQKSQAPDLRIQRKIDTQPLPGFSRPTRPPTTEPMYQPERRKPSIPLPG